MKKSKKVTKYFSDHGVLHADNCSTLEQAANDKKLSLSALSRGSYPGERLPENYLSELLSIGLWDCRKKQDWYLTPHRNEGIEITYLLKGSLNFGIDSESFQLAKGDIAFTRPWQQHYLGKPAIGYSKLFWLIIDVKVRKPDDKWQWPNWLILSPEDMHELTNRLQHTEQQVWTSNSEVQHLVEKLCQFLQDDMSIQQASYSSITLLINELLLLLLSLLKTEAYSMNHYLSSTNHTVERFLSAMPTLCGEEWTLDLMAAECGLKRSQFSEYCYQLKGMSPIDCLRECRIILAKSLLTNSELNVTDIAFKTGFGSSQYFATVFKKSVGMTPACYRTA